MFEFDDGSKQPDIQVYSAKVEPGQRIRITNHKRADSEYRRVLQNIEAHEDPEALDLYMERESLLIDALALFDSYAAEDLHDKYRDHRSMLQAGLECEARNASGW